MRVILDLVDAVFSIIFNKIFLESIQRSNAPALIFGRLKALIIDENAFSGSLESAWRKKRILFFAY